MIEIPEPTTRRSRDPSDRRAPLPPASPVVRGREWLEIVVLVCDRSVDDQTGLLDRDAMQRVRNQQQVRE